MRHLLSAVLLLTTACGGGGALGDIEDPTMVGAAEDLGDQSADVATLDPAAEEGTVEASVTLMGSSLQTMVSTHQSLSAQASVGLSLRAPADLAAKTVGSEDGEVSWDGERLVVNVSYGEAGASFTYAVDLTMTVDGTAVVMDGTYDLDYDFGAPPLAYRYAVSATYNSVRIEDGCAVSGSVDLAYDVDLDGVPAVGAAGAVNESGRMEITYAGCDSVTVRGT